MNIHFDCNEIKNSLDKRTVFKVRIGSHMYGLDNSKSDIDYLSIYTKTNEENDSFLWEHHQLQYKEKGIDYNYTDLQTFIRNILTGDSTINFEVLYSDDLKNSELSWLEKYKSNFINYNVIKSYLGLAKRDLKIWKSTTKKGNYSNSDSDKKLSHFFRGVIVARMLLDKKYTSNFNETKTFDNENDFEILYTSKTGSLNNLSHIVMQYENYMLEIREELNDKLNDCEIHKYGSISFLKELDVELKEFLKLKRKEALTKQKDLELNFGDEFYNILENGIKYTSKV
jgi:predicted nucleotidyltransferase